MICPNCGATSIDLVLTSDPMGNTDEYWQCEICDMIFEDKP